MVAAGVANSVGLDDARESAATEASMLAPGARVGPYVLEERIGAGGMGEVWRARREGAGPEGGRVALKVALGAASVDALRKQGSAQRRLDHSAIVRVLEEDLASEPPYIAFELIQGSNLRAHLRAWDEEAQSVVAHRAAQASGGTGGKSPDEARASDERAIAAFRTRRAVPVLRAVAEALAYAHAKGIVHADVKPENVLVGTDGRALLTDFGLGTTAFAGEVALSRSLASATLGGGTPAYLAPERHHGAPPTPAADVWSFGVMLFEACHGRLPQGLDRPQGWELAELFSACYAPLGARLHSGATLAAAFDAKRTHADGSPPPGAPAPATAVSSLGPRVSLVGLLLILGTGVVAMVVAAMFWVMQGVR